VIERAEPGRLAWALRRAAEAGPFFDLPAGVAGGVVAGPDWYRHADLTAPAGRPVLAAVVADHARRLRTAEPRVAASLLFQGYAGRLWSPVLACLRDGVVLDLDPAQLWLYCRAGESVTPRLTALAGWVGDDPAAVVDGLLAPMADALRRITPVSAALLWGNAASALAGALLMLAAHDPAGAAGAPRAAVARLLATGPLAGTGTLAPAGARPPFRRRSCCLYYRVPGGGLCADCALTRVPAGR
jgi:iron complex transport system ATP-binding protein